MWTAGVISASPTPSRTVSFTPSPSLSPSVTPSPPYWSAAQQAGKWVERGRGRLIYSGVKRRGCMSPDGMRLTVGAYQRAQRDMTRARQRWTMFHSVDGGVSWRENVALSNINETGVTIADRYHVLYETMTFDGAKDWACSSNQSVIVAVWPFDWAHRMPDPPYTPPLGQLSTRDGGLTWASDYDTATWSPPFDRYAMTTTQLSGALCISSDGRVVFRGVGASPIWLYRSVDAGLSWARLQTFTTGFTTPSLHAIACNGNGSSLVICGGGAGEVYRSFDFGVTVAPEAFYVGRSDKCTAVAMSPDGTQIAISGWGTNSFLSRDGGATYTVLVTAAVAGVSDAMWNTPALTNDGSIVLLGGYVFFDGRASSALQLYLPDVVPSVYWRDGAWVDFAGTWNSAENPWLLSADGSRTVLLGSYVYTGGYVAMRTTPSRPTTTPPKKQTLTPTLHPLNPNQTDTRFGPRWARAPFMTWGRCVYLQAAPRWRSWPRAPATCSATSLRAPTAAGTFTPTPRPPLAPPTLPPSRAPRMAPRCLWRAPPRGRGFT
jgi:hypothetical protein